MSIEIRKGRTVVFQLHAHIVFVAKYRKKVFDYGALELLRKYFKVILADFDADLVEFNGEDNYVHLLINYPPKVSLSKLVNSLKGASSRNLRQDRPDIKEKCFGAALWSPSYFIGSVGGAPIAVLKEYIDNQNTPIQTPLSPPRPEGRGLNGEKVS